MTAASTLSANSAAQPEKLPGNIDTVLQIKGKNYVRILWPEIEIFRNCKVRDCGNNRGRHRSLLGTQLISFLLSIFYKKKDYLNDTSINYIASVSIFNFLTAWEEYPWANTVINDTGKRTLPIAIAGFFGQHQFTQWGYVFAMSVLTLIPVVLIFILCQKFFVQGLTAGSVKG